MFLSSDLFNWIWESTKYLLWLSFPWDWWWFGETSPDHRLAFWELDQKYKLPTALPQKLENSNYKCADISRRKYKGFEHGIWRESCKAIKLITSTPFSWDFPEKRDKTSSKIACRSNCNSSSSSLPDSIFAWSKTSFISETRAFPLACAVLT